MYFAKGICKVCGGEKWKWSENNRENLSPFCPSPLFMLFSKAECTSNISTIPVWHFHLVFTKQNVCQSHLEDGKGEVLKGWGPVIISIYDTWIDNHQMLTTGKVYNVFLSCRWALMVCMEFNFPSGSSWCSGLGQVRQEFLTAIARSSYWKRKRRSGQDPKTHAYLCLQ